MNENLEIREEIRVKPKYRKSYKSFVMVDQTG